MFRIRAGLNQTELAERVGVAQATIARYENRTRSPRSEALGRLADALGVEPWDLAYAEQVMERRLAVERLAEELVEDVGAGGRRKAAYSFRELRRYDGCSLQYRFAEILGLPEKNNAYQAFHNSVYRVLGDMEVEAERLGRNPSLVWAKGRLEEVWEEEGPTGHFYEGVYRRRAETVVRNWQASEGALRWRLRQKLALPGPERTKIEVTVDAVRRDEDGTIVLARHMFGRPRKGHAEKDRLDLYSLYVAAAREAWPGKEARVVLRYLTMDESVEVRVTERVLSNRVGKMVRHAEGVLAGRFPPRPGRACKSCPWNFFCTASA